MADFVAIRKDECLRKKKPAGCKLNASHTFVLQSVINEIKQHGRSSMHLEVCGVLLGNLCFDGEPYLLIDARIEGRHASHQSGSVTFTSETWDYINGEKESKYPDKKIVGWYHTHPGFGIFLSNMDAFIHNNFFSFKWQPAYVFDPQAETDGFFFSNGASLDQEEVVVIPDTKPIIVAPKFSGGGEKIEILTKEVEEKQENRRFSTIILSSLLVIILAFNVMGGFIVKEKMALSKKKADEQIQALSARVQELEAAHSQARTSRVRMRQRPQILLIDNNGGCWSSDEQFLPGWPNPQTRTESVPAPVSPEHHWYDIVHDWYDILHDKYLEFWRTEP